MSAYVDMLLNLFSVNEALALAVGVGQLEAGRGRSLMERFFNLAEETTTSSTTLNISLIVH